MKNKIYFIHDEMKNEWDSDELALYVNDDVAIRAFKDMVKEPTFINKHAEDFILYRAGYVDAEKGIVSEHPTAIITAKQVKKVIEAEGKEAEARKALAENNQ